MKIGLFFGSFNPIHIGHCIIAQFALEQFNLDRLYFIVSPHNPFKDEKSLAPLSKRFSLVNTACLDMNYKFKVSEIEFQLPKPSYTSQTLRWLVSNDNKGDSGEREYFIIMGMDCLAQIDKWKDYEYIIDNFQILVYKRVGYNFDYSSLPFKFPVKEIDAPIIELSSTMIRERIKNKQSLKYLVPDCLLSSIKNLEYFQ